MSSKDIKSNHEDNGGESENTKANKTLDRKRKTSGNLSRSPAFDKYTLPPISEEEKKILDMFVDDDEHQPGGLCIDSRDLYKWLNKLMGDYKKVKMKDLKRYRECLDAKNKGKIEFRGHSQTIWTFMGEEGSTKVHNWGSS